MNSSLPPGLAAAHTWADYLTYEMEHGPFDMTKLAAAVSAALGPAVG